MPTPTPTSRSEKPQPGPRSVARWPQLAIATSRGRSRRAVPGAHPFDDFFRNATAGFALFDADLRYVRINATLAAMHGVPAEQHIGRTMGEMVPWLAPVVLPLFERVFQTGEAIDNVEISGVDSAVGPLRHWVASLFPVHGPSGAVEGAGAVVVEVTERKCAEDRCRETERRFHDLLQNVELIAITLDEAGTVSFCNDCLLRLTGWTRDEIVGADWFARFLPSSYADERAMFRQSLATGMIPRIHENPIVTRAGELRHIRWNNTTLHDAHGRVVGVASIGEDMTARRHAEEALRKTEFRLRQLAESIHEVFWLVDSETKAVLYVSPAYQTIWGRTCDSLVAAPDSWLDAVHPDDRSSVAGHGSPQPVQEYRIIRPDGEVRWICERAFPVRDDDGCVYRVAGVAEDITERKAAEIARRATEERINAVFQSAPIAIVCSTPDGRFVEANQQVKMLWGFDRAELVGHTGLDLNLWVDVAERSSIIGRVMRDGAVLNEEVRFRRKNGEVCTALLSMQKLQLSHEPLIIAMIVDVTNQKSMEAQLHRAERMESIGRLASGIAHDMNNILAPIMMSAPLLRMPLQRDDREKTLARIEISAQRGADLVRQLLTLGRGADSARGLVDLARLVREIVKMSGETFPKSIEIETELPAHLWSVNGNASQLHQVLLNLCVNARDAMPGGGRLRITGENLTREQPHAADCGTVAPGDYVKLCVADTGSGIALELRDRIFDPFFTTKEPGKGTGLGLATVAGIVKVHGGHVAVRSTVGQGTTFEILLPATRQETAPTDPVVEESTIRGRAEHILVVDDEDPVRMVLRETLTRHGYRVTTATDGADALVAYTKLRRQVAVVVTDLDMPVVDGASLIRALRRMCPELRIIVSTGLDGNTSTERRRHEIEALGVTGWVAKPYRAQQLLSAVHDALHREEPGDNVDNE